MRQVSTLGEASGFRSGDGVEDSVRVGREGFGVSLTVLIFFFLPLFNSDHTLSSSLAPVPSLALREDPREQNAK